MSSHSNLSSSQSSAQLSAVDPGSLSGSQGCMDWSDALSHHPCWCRSRMGRQGFWRMRRASGSHQRRANHTRPSTTRMRYVQEQSRTSATPLARHNKRESLCICCAAAAQLHLSCALQLTHRQASVFASAV